MPLRNAHSRTVKWIHENNHKVLDKRLCLCESNHIHATSIPHKPTNNVGLLSFLFFPIFHVFYMYVLNPEFELILRFKVNKTLSKIPYSSIIRQCIINCFTAEEFQHKNSRNYQNSRGHQTSLKKKLNLNLRKKTK